METRRNTLGGAPVEGGNESPGQQARKVKTVKKLLIISLSMIAAVVVGTADGAKADSGTTRVTKGVLSPTHVSNTLAEAPADDSCNPRSRACQGNYGTTSASDADKSQRLLALTSPTTITKGSVSFGMFDEGEVANSEQAIEEGGGFTEIDSAREVL